MKVPMFYEDGSPAPEREKTEISRGTFHWEEDREEACRRCGGQGGGQHWPGFTCYECHGARRKFYHYKFFSFTAENLSKRNARREKRAEAQVDKLLDENARREVAAQPWIDLLAPYEEVLAKMGKDARAAHDRNPSKDNIIYDYIIVKDANNTRIFEWLTEKRARWIAKLAEDRLEHDEIMSVVPSLEAGRREVIGTMLSFKMSEGQFLCLKMVVQLDDGNKIYGSVPRDIEPTPNVKIKFTGTISPSSEDPHWGFFSIPKKASIIV